MAGEIFSIFTNGLPAASAVTANTRLAGIENTGPTAQQYAPTTTGAASSIVATNGSGEVVGNHFIGGGSTPTVAGGSAMGSGGSLAAPTVVGTDVSFAVTLTTGLSTTSGTVFTITFANPFKVAPPAPTLTAGNLTAGAQMIARVPLASCTTTTLTVTVQSGLSSNTTYVFFIRP